MLHVLIGAVTGAALGAGATLVKSWIKDEPVDWKSVGAAALGGAAAGAVASATFGAGLLAGSTAAQVTGMTLAGATGGAIEQTTDNVLHDRAWHEDVAEQAALGGALGLTAGAGRVVARPLARSIGSWGPAQVVGRTAQRAWTPVANTGKRGWQAYMRSMQRAPMRTKIATSGTLTFAGDSVAQLLEPGRTSWDWKRTLYRTGWSVALTPVGHYWLVGLDKLVPWKGAIGSIAKVVLDQVAFFPVLNGAFFMSYAMVHDGKSPAEAWEVVKDKTPKAVGASMGIWGSAKFVSFRYIPLDFRIPFNRSFGFLYNVFFSLAFLGDDEPAAEPAPSSDPTPAESLPAEGLPPPSAELSARDAPTGAQRFERLIQPWQDLADRRTLAAGPTPEGVGLTAALEQVAQPR